MQSRPYRRDHLVLVVLPGHPLAGAERISFTESLAWEHVGLPVNSAVEVMLMRAVAEHGRRLNFRMIVSNFEAVMRIVRARLAISVVLMEAVSGYVDAYGLRMVGLTDAWAQRRFALCFRDADALAPAARLLVEFLEAKGDAVMESAIE